MRPTSSAVRPPSTVVLPGTNCVVPLPVPPRSKLTPSAAERVLSPPQLMLGGYWFPTPSLRLEAFAHARDAQRRVTNPDDNRVPPGGTPGSVSLHARLRWALTPSLTARVAVDNLGDALVLEHGSGFYAPGFSTSASLEARLGP